MYRKKVSINLLGVLAYAMIARFSCTALTNIPLFSIKFIFIYGIAFIVLYLYQYGITRSEFAGVGAISIYILYVLIITFDEGLFHRHLFNAYILLFLYFIFMYMQRRGKEFTIRVGIFAVVGYAFTFLYSIPLLLSNPELARQMASSTAESADMGIMNFVGGFDSVYGGLLVVIILWFCLQMKTTNMQRVLFLIGIISGIVFMVLSSYGTVLVLLCVGLIMILFRKNKMWATLIMILLGLGFYNRVAIGEMINDFSNNIEDFKTMQVKLRDIASMLITGKSSGTLAGEEGRLARMIWSWNAFLQYPITGGYGKAPIGHHSTFFDTLGMFGLLGTVPLLAFSYKVGKGIIDILTTKPTKTCFSIIGILYIVMAILDPALYTQQVLPFFCIMPMLCCFEEKKGSCDV